MKSINISKSNHYNNFNLLRLFAALQVVYIHTIEHFKVDNEYIILFSHLLSYFPGVPIFFLISGYLISMSYDKNSNIKEYAKNRILRIYPALYLNFFVGIGILWYFGQFIDVSIVNIISWSIAQLTFFQFYNPEFIRDFGVGVINGSLWTISVELAFYIILPFIYIFLKKDFYKKFFFLIFISLIFYYYNLNINTKTFIYEKLIAVSILPHLFYFLIGLAFYKFKNNILTYIEDKVIICFSLYMILSYFSMENFIYLLVLKLIFSVFIFSFIFSYKSLTYRLLKHNDFTYGIYIYHMLIVNIFVQLGYMGGGRTPISGFILINNLRSVELLFSRETIFKAKKEKSV